MNARNALAVISIALASCATQKTVYLPDGRQGYSISCHGSALSWEACYAKAGEICRASGYDLISKTGEQGNVVSGSQYGVFGGSTYHRSMMIACKQ